MIELRRLTIEDYAQCGEVAPWVDVARLVQHGWAFYDDDRLVGCAGVLPYWPGVGEAWLAMAPTYEGRDLLPAVRTIRTVLGGYAEQYRRIQADVLPDLAQWMRVLGFAFESEMPSYGPEGATYHRYVRFPRGS